MSTTPRSRLRAQKTPLPHAAVQQDGTRRRILEEALQLFANEGFHGASIRTLAKAVGLQPSTLYSHFPSKEHVLAELARVGHEAHHEALREALLSAGPGPVEQVRALVRAHTLQHATHPQLAVVVNEELYALAPELAAPALAQREKSSALLVEAISRGVALGVFTPPEVLVTAAAIATMGLRIPYWYEPSEALPIDRLADLHAELALRMLGVRLSP